MPPIAPLNEPRRKIFNSELGSTAFLNISPPKIMSIRIYISAAIIPVKKPFPEDVLAHKNAAGKADRTKTYSCKASISHSYGGTNEKTILTIASTARVIISEIM